MPAGEWTHGGFNNFFWVYNMRIQPTKLVFTNLITTNRCFFWDIAAVTPKDDIINSNFMIGSEIFSQLSLKFHGGKLQFKISAKVQCCRQGSPTLLWTNPPFLLNHLFPPFPPLAIKGINGKENTAQLANFAWWAFFELNKSPHFFRSA